MRVMLPLVVAAGAAVFLLARCGEESGTGPAPGPVVRIQAPFVHLAPGDSVWLEAAAMDADHQMVDAEEIEWSSSDAGVVSVEDGGLVRAVGHGEATIRAEIEGGADEIAATVGPAVLVGAGDIASCGTDGDDATAELLDAIEGVVFTTGDNAYPNGTTMEFMRCYDPTWGRHKGRTRPTPGNHDYLTVEAAPYYEYFGEAAGEEGKGYYSYDLGGWHIVVLNSEIETGPDSEQLRWLRADLAAHPAPCILAYWHRPLFSSDDLRGNPKVKPFWEALYEAGAELVVNGHDHYYDRYAPQTPDGAVDLERGIRQIVVGTGGQPPHPSAFSPENREVHDGATIGVLKLTLHPDRYAWEFMPAAGGTFTDSGDAPCH
ncbi:MAG TPA: metallophosphoesterase [Longimicrobiales bacterium]